MLYEHGIFLVRIVVSIKTMVMATSLINEKRILKYAPGRRVNLKSLIRIILVMVLAVIMNKNYSQETKIWSLEECINYALDHNISIKKQMLGITYQEELLLQSKLGILPSFNGYASHGYNWGQRIDPFTNEFATDRVRSNNLYLQGDLNLFSGLQQLNTIKRNKTMLLAAQYDADYYKDEIAITVAMEYLQTLYYMEFVSIAESQLDITRQQVERTKKLVDAGTLAKGDLLTIEAQFASEELSLVEARNNLNLSYLTLTQLLELQSVKGFEIEKPEIGLLDQPEIYTPEQIYSVALGNRPEIKSAEAKVESSRYDLNIAKGTLYPVLSLDGSIGSGYSGANEVGSDPFYEEKEFGYWYTEDPLNPVKQVYITTSGYQSYKAKPFGDQLEDNLNETMSLNLRIPIFNGWQSRSSVAQAKIGIEDANLDLQLQKNNLLKIIQQAYNDALAASNKFKASEKKVQATEESFKYAEQKFNVGLINSVEYNDAKKEFNVALSEQIQSKYDFVFRTTVLDFYMGKPLTLKK
jgi:outer membrane protein